MKAVPLTGRDKELKVVEGVLVSPNTRQVVLIEGDGGIGKTRLLQEIFSRFADAQENLKIAHIIDFDESSYSLPESLEFKIASEFGSQVTEPYLEQLQDLRRMELIKVSLENLMGMRQKLTEILAKKLNDLTDKKKAVIILDTLDKLDNARTIECIKDLIRLTENVVFVLAGRALVSQWESLLISMNADITTLILQPLDSQSSISYFDVKQRQLSITIEPELLKNLLILTNGRPILIDLAVEYLSRDEPIKWLTPQYSQELEKLSLGEQKEVIKEFEFSLVKPYSDIRTDLDRLILLMSRIYPINVDMIVDIFGVSEVQALHLFDEARRRVFVKTLPSGMEISLHDEMRKMISQNLWIEIDVQGERRRNDSFKAAKYYSRMDDHFETVRSERHSKDSQNIYEFRDKEDLAKSRNENTEKWMYHALFSDIKKGFELWENVTSKIRTKARNYFFAERLVQIAGEFYDQFDADMKFNYDLLHARLLVDVGKPGEGKEKFLKLLEENKEGKSSISSVYNALGVVELKAGNLEKALDYQLKCFSIIKETNKPALPFVANQIGYINRLAANLKEALEYYEMALALEDNKDEKDSNLIASLLNNIGYVYGLQKKYDLVDSYCGKAVEIWVNNGYERDAARAEISLGIFARDQRNYEISMRFLSSAINRCVDPDDHEILCPAYFHKGWALFYQAEQVILRTGEISEIRWDESLMNDALVLFQKSLDLAQAFDHKADLPGILLLTGTVKWYLGGQLGNSNLRQEAKSVMDEAYRMSKETGYIRYIIHSLTRKAEFDYEEGLYDRVAIYVDELYHDYGEKIDSFPLYFGRMLRIEGDIFLRNSDFISATEKYSESMPLIKRHGGFGRYSISRELERFEAKLSNLPSNISKKIVLDLKKKWLQLENQDDVSALVKWCDLQLL